MSTTTSLPADQPLPAAASHPPPPPPAIPPPPATTPPTLTLQVTSDWSTLAPLRAEWDELVVACGSPIYLTFDWVRLWWKFYGAGKTPLVFVFREGQRLVAVLPLYLDTCGFPPCGVRLARLIGAHLPRKAFDPPVTAHWSEAVFSAVLRHLHDTVRVDLWSFGPVTETWPGQAGLRAALASPPLQQHATWTLEDVVTIFPLPATWADFEAGLNKKERHTRKEKLRQLTRAHRIATEMVGGMDAVAEFERFLAQHTTQWRREGMGGHFEAWPRAQDFHRALVRTFAAQDRVRFVRLVADGQVVASRYIYVLGQRLFAELPSREVGADWDRLGLGTSSYYLFLAAAIGEGHREINSGLGHYDYKVRLGGQERAVGLWRIVRPARLSAWRVGVFRLCSRIAIGVLVKIWQRRLLPHLPCFFPRRRPLLSIRLDA